MNQLAKSKIILYPFLQKKKRFEFYQILQYTDNN